MFKLINIQEKNWPSFDEKIIEENETNFVVQINGKKRGIIKAEKNILKKKNFKI